jgi:hypothetical protein
MRTASNAARGLKVFTKESYIKPLVLLPFVRLAPEAPLSGSSWINLWTHPCLSDNQAFRATIQNHIAPLLIDKLGLNSNRSGSSGSSWINLWTHPCLSNNQAFRAIKPNHIAPLLIDKLGSDFNRSGSTGIKLNKPLDSPLSVTYSSHAWCEFS